MKIIKINPLFFAVLGIVLFTGEIVNFSMMYITLILHELTHLFFLAKNRLVVEKIIIEPFGISIAIKNNNIENPFVYLSAPIFNLIFAGLLYAFCYHYKIINFSYFIIANLSIGLFNLIPIIPFDGGKALQIYFSKKYGNIAASKIFTTTSFIFSLSLIIFGFYFVYITGFNYSIVIIGIFLLYNSITEKRLIADKAVSRFSGMEYRGNIEECIPIVTVAVPEEYPAHKLLRNFSENRYYIIKTVKDGVVTGTITETRIINKIISTKGNISVSDCR